MMKTKRKWIIGICAPVCLAFLILAGCDSPAGPEEEPGTPAETLPVVSFAVNAAGTAFESVGTDTSYTAAAQGGTFETVNGLKVFNTGGTTDGTQSEIPWWEGNYWDNYTGIGYVDLGTELGDLLISLPSFSVETYVCLPSNAQADRVGQYVWAFTDHVAPANQVSFNIREFTFRIKQDNADEDVNVGWDSADPVRGNGTWHHIVVVKNAADNTGTIYWDGSVKQSGPSTKAMSGFAEGTFTHNTLGGEVYANGVYDQQLFNTKFHSFSIYDYALSADEVTSLKDTGVLDTLNGN